MGESKKSPNAAGAAALILILTLILVAYIIFLPGEQRIELLGEEPSQPGEEKQAISTIPEENFLLKENIGHLSVVSGDKKTFSLPNFVLEETKPDIIIREINTFQVYNGWISELRKIIPFSIPEKELVSMVHVSFQTSLKSGVLIVGLNGAEIYHGRVGQSSVLLSVDSSGLEKKNQLTFHVEGGLFENQEYQIDDLKIIATVEEKEALISHQYFSLSESEFNNVEEGKLKFFITCSEQNVGHLTVSANGKQLFSSIPVCDDVVELNLFKEDLKSGRNILSFEGNKGVYEISKPEVSLKLGEAKGFLGYFNINNRLYSDAVLDNFKKIVLEIDFVDDKKNKELRLSVNGYTKSINQRDKKFRWVLSEARDALLAGRNYVELNSLKPVDIVELRIFVE